MEGFSSILRFVTVLFAVLFLSVRQADGCGGGSSSCSWRTCSQTWSGYSPNPSNGQCVWQYNRVSHHYNTHSRSSGCPGDTHCSGRDQSRVMCSCLQAVGCWWASWGTWTGHITPGTCGKQRRTRSEHTQTRYNYRQNSCNGVQPRCQGKYTNEERTMCNCRKAESCPVFPWSSWAPAAVNGECKFQGRYQDKNPQYTYVSQQNNCHGINPNCNAMRVMDHRTFCRCKYLECIQGAWSSWEVASWTGSCPNERRLKPYREIVKYKDAYTTCKGVGTQQCPSDHQQSREKEVTCPKLPVPTNGKHLDRACDGANSKCTSICRLECNKGYKIVGNPYASCHGTGKWNQEQGSCVDSEKPQIECPRPQQYVNEENTNYREIDLKEATATDNSNLPVTITMSHSSPLKVSVDNSVDVTYTAVDAAGNVKKCTSQYIVIDNEPPKVKKCPDSYRLIKTGTFPHRVFWKSAQFQDNVDSTNQLKISSSITNGAQFSKGTHTIIITATDRAANTANCTFVIELERVKCPVSAPPKHGSAQCNIKKNGIKESFVCTVSCKKGSWFLQGPNIPKLYNFYFCSQEGDWAGTMAYNMDNLTPTSAIIIPKGQPLWPDCSVGVSPDGTELEMQVFGGKCTDEASMENLKRNFVATLIKDFILGNLFCTSYEKNCAIENIIVYCAKRRRRNLDGSQSSQMVVKFAFAVREKILAASPTADMKKLNILSAKLENEKQAILQNVRSKAQKILNDYTASVSVSQKAKISCEPGYEFKIPNGSKEQKCLECPRGTYFDGASRKCVVCKNGFFQDGEGALSCKKCPAGKTTLGLQGTDFHACKEICPIGTYSSNGLETCKACPIATYQPLVGSTSCNSCPNGKVTEERGSASLDDCTLAGINYELHSEGCDDPGITGCGTSTIKVNGVGHSKKSRGINFVAVDGKTGNVVDSQFFDWHGDRSACSKALSWLKSLSDHTVVFGVYQDEATNYYYPQYCDAALAMIGGRKPFQREYRGSFTIAGYKGKAAKPSWVAQKMSSHGRGPTDQKGNFKLMPSFHYEIHSEGCADPGKVAGTCGVSTIKVDGKNYSNKMRGINLVVLDGKTGNFLSKSSFDWHGDRDGCNKALKWVTELPDESIVLGAYQDDAAWSFSLTTCGKALEMIGAVQPLQTQYRASFAIAGYKGKDKPYFVQQKTNSQGKGPTVLNNEIILNV